MNHRDDTHHTVLLLILSLNALSRELAPLPHRHERRPKPQSNDRAKQKSTRIKTDDDINLFAGRVGDGVRGEVVDEVCDQCFESYRVSQEREEVEENDALYFREDALRLGRLAEILTFLGKSGYGLNKLFKYAMSAMV